MKELKKLKEALKEIPEQYLPFVAAEWIKKHKTSLCFASALIDNKHPDYVVVRREPTDEIIDAFFAYKAPDGMTPEEVTANEYKAMINATKKDKT